MGSNTIEQKVELFKPLLLETILNPTALIKSLSFIREGKLFMLFHYAYHHFRKVIYRDKLKGFYLLFCFRFAPVNVVFSRSITKKIRSISYSSFSFEVVVIFNESHVEF